MSLSFVMPCETATESMGVAFGRWLKRLRQSREMTQEHLGSFVGMTRQQISRIETGSREVNDSATVRGFARALQCDLAEVAYRWALDDPHAEPIPVEGLVHIPVGGVAVPITENMIVVYDDKLKPHAERLTNAFASFTGIVETLVAGHLRRERESEAEADLSARTAEGAEEAEPGSDLPQ